MKITNISLAHKTSVFVLLVIIFVGGLTSYVGLPVESFPDIKQPVVFVAAPYVGVAPSDMETLVLKPLEDQLEEIAKIKRMTSQASEGYASITCEFEPDIEVDEAVRRGVAAALGGPDDDAEIARVTRGLLTDRKSVV